MKVLLLSGEESGEIYARRLRALMPAAEIRGYADYGFKLADLAVMGFLAVIKKLPYFLRVRRTMERAIDQWRPDAVLSVDYPGMNLRLAAYAKRKGIKTVHLVCPQVWAWKRSRVPKIEAALDHLCCFFPFEPQYFKAGFAEFVGHPLAEDFPKREIGDFERGLVALLPGSRIGEIERNLPVMVEAVRRLDGVRALIPAANARALAAIERVLAGISGGADAGRQSSVAIEVCRGGARELLLRAEMAVVASGTATLEAALARCPTVLVYKVDAFLAWFARRVIKDIHHIGIVNIIWEKTGGRGEEPMVELLQEAFTAEAVSSVLRKWRDNPDLRERAAARLGEVAAQLFGDGQSLQRVVKMVLQ